MDKFAESATNADENRVINIAIGESAFEELIASPATSLRSTAASSRAE